jgi:hypothetical protein
MDPVTPEVVHFGNRTTAKLKPWPVVVRLASGTSFELESAVIERELMIAAHLAIRHASSQRVDHALITC